MLVATLSALITLVATPLIMYLVFIFYSSTKSEWDFPLWCHLYAATVVSMNLFLHLSLTHLQCS